MPAFSVSEVFGRPIRGNCPATNIDIPFGPVCVDKAAEQNLHAFHVQGGTPQIGRSNESGQICYNLAGILTATFFKTSL